mmetsp:Transcript_43941/g.61751  ORF Transcript_43941/g.61751 Transcript_43941/m.61751 type:complete len:157 (-) Transcript_43941:247-717(-)
MASEKKLPASVIRRLQKELAEITDDPPCNCSAGLSGERVDEWVATVLGPPDTPYSGGIFYLIVNFPANYPYKPPKVTFRTKIYHVNIDTSGNICLDILKNAWTPALTVSKVLLSICSLLSNPNPYDPMLPELAKRLKNDPDGYEATVRSWTKKYAT